MRIIKMLTYEIDGDTVTIDDEKKADLNALASRFYSRLGYKAKEGFDFSASEHPQEQMVWTMAIEAYYMHISSGIFD
ncbi:hypothetical protein [Alteromonas macleodii]|uniref:hypothetical protein n=1 Tax=Alteromonas macleodii TaxID=28108 RepID=UPI003140AB7F